MLIVDGLQKWQKFSNSVVKKLEEAQTNLNLQLEAFKNIYVFQEKQEQKCLIWNLKSCTFLLVQVDIVKTKNKEVRYLKDGEIMRIDQIKNASAKPEVLTNLEQIKYLQWQGNYGLNNHKIGQWKILWDCKILDGVGGEYREGEKQGQWKEPIKNYWSLSQVYEIGQYDKDKNKGSWKLIENDNKIGGGQYNCFGQKEGKWIDIYENFFNYAKVTCVGNYDKNGMKIGKWDILQNSGGGQNDQEGNQKKIGKWVELDEKFRYYKQVINCGEYNLNGMKIGLWDIMYCKDKQKLYRQIGGGCYGSGDNSKKIGKWVEFSFWKQPTYNGEYNFQGMKIGRWDIMYFIQGKKEYKLIGEDNMIQKDQRKIGK
ncbi:unnamed protein product [Paramecium sonneborni]|uniref:Uncharacterized protein n=1 Tax=Paramecium sonneborni TaxID=65129 RepID=A0A8S1LPY0_9CILI|nr:unnamed protein product [Paramecium sonneborni]